MEVLSLSLSLKKGNSPGQRKWCSCSLSRRRNALLSRLSGFFPSFSPGKCSHLTFSASFFSFFRCCCIRGTIERERERERERGGKERERETFLPLMSKDEALSALCVHGTTVLLQLFLLLMREKDNHEPSKHQEVDKTFLGNDLAAHSFRQSFCTRRKELLGSARLSSNVSFFLLIALELPSFGNGCSKARKQQRLVLIKSIVNRKANLLGILPYSSPH